MWLIFVLFTLVVYVDAVNDAAECVQGCFCHPVSPAIQLNVNCFNISDANEKRLSHELDAMLSDDRYLNLSVLSINNSPLTRVPASVCKLANVTWLSLNHNKLTELPDNCFTKLTKLATLTVTNNTMTGLQDGLFDGLQSLANLDFSQNRISFIGLRLFSNSTDLTSLRSIDLSGNRLTSLEPWWYYRCILGSEQSPVEISLKNNLISNFTNELKFQYRCGMKPLYGSLDFSNNRISHIMDMINGWNMGSGSVNATLFCLSNYRGTHPLMNVNFAGVSYDCDCIDFPIYKLVKHYSENHILDGVRCNAANFYNPAGQPYVTSVPLIEFKCQIKDRCPSSCRCVYRPEKATLHVYCSASNLSSLPLELPPLPKSSVKYELDFSNNKQLSRLEHRPYFANTSILNVSGCSLTEINAKVLKDVSRFTWVNVRKNKLQSFPRQADTVNISAGLFLGGNPWRCSCEDSWMIGWLKSLLRSRQIQDKGNIICRSPLRMYGRNVLKSTEDDFCIDPVERYLTVIVCLAVVVGTALLLLAAVLLLYKFRVQFYKKWKFHPFDRDECVGENLDFDVFLCCSPEDDEPHGLRVLRDMESSGYHVYYHERDDVPGQSITENMVHVVERSKRTVCLITRNFLESSYCMTEFDLAYHHNVALKRKKRLIALKMLNSPTDLYANDASDTATLRQYLRQYTYIDYTADDYLDKLLYALPLRGLLQHNQDRDNDDVQLLENVGMQ